MYDEERRPTGETAERFGGFPDGGLHLVVHVCVFDRQGRMLIQRRQETKAAWPGRWDLSAGGCALAGESSRQAASRETREELGFDPALEGVRPALTVNFSRGFDDHLLHRARCGRAKPAPAGRGSHGRPLGRAGRRAANDRRGRVHPLPQEPHRAAVRHARPDGHAPRALAGKDMKRHKNGRPRKESVRFRPLTKPYVQIQAQG